MTTTDTNNEYINTTDYKKLENKIKDVVSVMDDLSTRNTTARNLRYVEIDVEKERSAGRLDPDAVFVPEHIIDTNIRREQASYIQYLTQSSRACILENIDVPSMETTQLEKDLTNRIRYNDWQIPMFANVDGMQQNGYGMVEMIYDESTPGNQAYDFVILGDFGMPLDTKNIQEAEMVSRNYYFSKTALLKMCEPNSGWDFDVEQTKKVTDAAPSTPLAADDNVTAGHGDRTLYRIQKIMFRVKGVVQVGWSCVDRADNWLRKPRPLFIGRKKALPQPTGLLAAIALKIQGPPTPQFEDEYETQYPYYLFPYLISENNTIEKLKGRAYLDQDTQTAATSLLTSYCTAHKRASGLYFSKDATDPNDDLLMQKNIYLKTGALINSKITSFQLNPPDASMLTGIQTIIGMNQAETSKVNFAAQNRKDSRKTATEISAATQEAASLSTVQVVLFSTALKKLYTQSFMVIRSRVAAGLILVTPELQAQYAGNYSIRPSGDVDVIERQQLIAMMQQAWPVIQATPIAQVFLIDMISKMFPEQAAKYKQVLEQAMATQQSAAAQQQQAMMQKAVGIGKQLISLSDRPEMFSTTGKVYALPAIQQVAEELSQFIGKDQVGNTQQN